MKPVTADPFTVMVRLLSSIYVGGDVAKMEIVYPSGPTVARIPFWLSKLAREMDEEEMVGREVPQAPVVMS